AEREALTTTMTEALAHFEAAPFSVAARETLGLPDVETAHLLFAAMADALTELGAHRGPSARA
ncbi:MAG: hypothetical protein AAGN82_27240, partial [Myxococcota bacterium]